jgi:hypothetical protein
VTRAIVCLGNPVSPSQLHWPQAVGRTSEHYAEAGQTAAAKPEVKRAGGWEADLLAGGSDPAELDVAAPQ